MATPPKVKMIDPEGLLPAKQGHLDLVEKMTSNEVGADLLDGDVKWLQRDVCGNWIEFRMKWRVQLLCIAYVASGGNLKEAGRRVKLEVDQASKALANIQARSYLSILLMEHLGDSAMTPEIFRSRVMQVEQDLLQGKITHHQAAQCEKLLTLYAKTAGYLVIEQERERKTTPEGFAPG